jgi:DNA repair exonuclease SbcCD ATPase subunit
MIKTMTGVDLTDTNGQFRSTYDILLGISKVWDTLDTKQQALLLENIAGKTQANVLASVLQNAKTLDKAYEKLTDSAGSAEAEQAAYMDSIAGKANALKENFRGIFYDLIDSSAVKGSLDVLNSLLSSYRSLADTLGNLPVLLATITGAFTMFSEKGRELAANTTELATAFGYNLPGELSKFGSGLDSLSGSLKSNTEELEKKSAKLKTEIQALRESVGANRENSTAIADSTKEIKSKSKELASATRQLALMKAGTIALNSAISMGLSVVISGVIGLLGKMASNSSEAAAKVRELSSTMKDMEGNENLLDQYAKVSEKMANLKEGDSERNELNERLKTIKGELANLDDEAYAILNNQNLSYQEQIDLLKAINDEKMKDKADELEKEIGNTGTIWDIFKDTEEDYAKAAQSSIKTTLGLYKDLQKEISNAKGGTINWLGDALSTEEASKKLKGYEDSMKSSMNTLDRYESKLQMIKNAKGDTKLASYELDEATEEEVRSLFNLNGAVDDTTNGLDNLKNKNDETVNSVKSLADAFSSFSSPISMLNSMIDEYQKLGGLTDETYQKVLDSGNKQLIALLSDDKNFMRNAQDLRTEMREGQTAAAKELIDTCAAEVAALDGLSQKALETSTGTTEGIKNVTEATTENIKETGKSGGEGDTSVEEEQLDNVSNKAQETVKNTKDAITETVEAAKEGVNEITGETTKSLDEQIAALKEFDLDADLGEKFVEMMGGLSESFKMTEDQAAEFKENIIAQLAAYVDAGNELYQADAINQEEWEAAKTQAKSVWASEQFQILADSILKNKSLYTDDEIAWAESISNRTWDTQNFSDETYWSIANMVIANAGLYGDDELNWAMALTNKDANQVQMINSLIYGIATMIHANSEAYGADANNWANALRDKDSNNDIACSSMSGMVAGLISFLATEYGKDADNFAQSTNSKISNLKEFVNALNSANAAAGTKKVISKYTPKNVKSTYGGGKGGGRYANNKNNYVSNVGNKGSGSNKKGSGNKGSGSSSSKEKEVEDMESLVDRYYDVNNALQKVENQLDRLDAKKDKATGKDRIKLLEEEIKLLGDKKTALMAVRNEQQQELAELKKTLSDNGFNFAADGTITNYESKLTQLTNAANSKTGDAKKKAIESVKDVAKKLEEYTDLLFDKIPETTNKIDGIGNSVADLRDEIEKLHKSTTFFTKDFADRYYEVNNALKQVENQLNALSTAMENASDNKLVELLDKQIQLYIEQGKALAEIRKENVKELNELGKELYDAGFKFNKDGTLANYESMIDKLVQNANKITDGEKQEKEIERIEKLVETIEKYTDLLLTDIPDITDEMNDLANAVIDSQKEIADILAKQRDEYIENLEKETEALRKEIERRKDILSKQWEEEDARDELDEKQKKLNELEDQLTIALRTGDEELIKSIREQISSAQKEINDFIRDKERDYISDRFDEDLDKIDEDLDSKIDEINEKLSDEELLKLVQGGVRDLSDVLNKIESGSKGVRNAFAAIGTTISETWINSLDTFMDKLNSLSDINLDFNIGSKLSKVMEGFEKAINITQGNLIVQGNITEDILPTVQNMIDIANNNLINDINAAFSR